MKKQIAFDRQALQNALAQRFTSIESITQFLPMAFWILSLSRTNSFYEIYVVTGLLGIFCWFRDDKGLSHIFNKSQRSELIISCVFSFLILAANYELFLLIANPYAGNNALGLLYAVLHYCIYLPFVFFGGVFAAFYILQFARQRLVPFCWKSYNYKLSNSAVFWGSFLLLFIFHSLILVLGYYPGALTYDSIEQIEQIISGVYSNHHPIYHTFLIRLHFIIGSALFDDINISVLLYSLFSVALTSFGFAYCLVTIYKIHVNKYIVIVVFISYMILPHHIFFSFTMWKDIPFSACVLIFVVSMFRYFNRLWINRYLCVFTIGLSVFAMGILRTNGLFILIILTLVFAVLFGRKRRKMTIALACISVMSFIMMRPVVHALDIPQPDTIESLSIPAQQIARTLKEYNDISPEDRELIARVASIDELKTKYLPYLSDPVKEAVRDRGNQQYLTQHKWDYFRLYIRLGVQHPDSYFKGWVDQTVGYWNGGYHYIRWKTGVYPNHCGIRRKAYIRSLNLFVRTYAEFVENKRFFRLFVSIGLHTWLIAFVLLIAIRKKDKLTALLTVPFLSLVLSLMIASPVYSEFRYVYSLFCCLPFLAVIAFRDKKNGSTAKTIKRKEVK